MASKMGSRGKEMECIFEIDRHEEDRDTRDKEEQCDVEEEQSDERSGEDTMRRRTGGKWCRSVMGKSRPQQQTPSGGVFSVWYFIHGVTYEGNDAANRTQLVEPTKTGYLHGIQAGPDAVGGEDQELRSNAFDDGELVKVSVQDRG